MASDLIAQGETTRATPGRRLRGLLQREKALLAVGAFGPMPAKIAQSLGFEAVYMPGGGAALNLLGVADLGLITMPEMVSNAAAIAAAVDLPVIADADSGFGNALNVRRTVKAYEAAGVAAIHLEDQIFPKRCGQMEGKKILPVQEACANLRAAVDAKVDPDFMIIARCDALTVEGLDATVARCKAYLDAGADMLFVESLNSQEVIEAIPKLLPAAHLFNMTASGKMPCLDLSQVTALGYKMMILPNYATLAAMAAIRDVFNCIKAEESVKSVFDKVASFEDMKRLGDYQLLQSLEEKYAT